MSCSSVESSNDNSLADTVNTSNITSNGNFFVINDISFSNLALCVGFFIYEIFLLYIEIKINLFQLL